MLVLLETRTPVKNGWDSDEPLINGASLGV